MKEITINNIYHRYPNPEVKIETENDQSFLDVINLYYKEIFPKQNSPSMSLFHSWEEFNFDTISEYQMFCTSRLAMRKDKHCTIHLIDRIKDISCEEIELTNPYWRHDDSIPFFLIEQYKGVIERIIEERSESQESLWEGVFHLLIKLISRLDSFLLVDNYHGASVDHTLKIFLQHYFPSALWITLEKEKMEYYIRFLVYFAYQICIMNYCLKQLKGKRKNIITSVCKSYIDKALFGIQYFSLNLLNIPEIFIRSISNSNENYSAILKSIGIQNPYKSKEIGYYKSNIVNNSVHQVFLRIFSDIPISDYYEYMNFCRDAGLSNAILARIIHTYRIIFNRLKHSSYVEIIKSRDDDAIRAKKLSELDEKISALKKDDKSDARIRKAEMERLEFEKEAVAKIRDAHGHLEFDDPDFKRKNGIRIMDDQGSQFIITLYDLEFLEKVLIGVLFVIDKAYSSP